MALKFAFKVVLASTAIYYTNQLEIWTRLSHQDKAYDQAISEVRRLINVNKPKSLKFELPNVVNKDLCATTNYYYNKGVTNTFESLLAFPSTLGKWYDRGVEQITTQKQK